MVAPDYLQEFFPTDEELIVHFLKRKVQSRDIIIEADVCRSDPWDLPGGGFFSRNCFE